jgi:hypothetical protein
MFRLFGEGLVIARLPALAAGTALVVLLFLWVRSFAGRSAAWAAGLLLCFSPGAIYLSQLCRFYSMQAVLFLGGTICAARLAAGRLRASAAAATSVFAFLLFALAFHLQIVSFGGIAAVALWFAAIRLHALPGLVRGGRRRIAGAALAAAAIVVCVLLVRESVLDARGYFSQTDPWAPENKESARYYHWFLLDLYPTLWTLFPVFALVALGRRPRESSLALVVFAVVLAVQSLAAWKSERYFAYVMPFFFAVVGVGLAEVLGRLRGGIAEALGAEGRREWVRRAAGPAASAAVALAVVFAAAGNGAFPMAWKLLTLDDSRWPYARLYRGEPNWEEAAERLRPLLGDDVVLLGPSDLKLLFYFGRVDYILSRAMLSDRGKFLPEFAPNWKTGVPTISEEESLRRVMRDGRPGLAIVEAKHMLSPWILPPETAAVLEREAEEIPLPAEWKLRAFRWGVSPVPPAAAREQAR